MPKDNNQETIFDDMDNLDWWKKEWKNMPEFKMQDLTSKHSVIVHFENEEHLRDFSQLIGQKVFTTTKSIWHPKLKIARYMNKRYIDEEE